MSVNQRVVDACQLYMRDFGQPLVVYYPGCGYDASPSLGFSDAEVIYLDPISQGLGEISRQFPGVKTIEGLAESFEPERPFDFVLDVHSHAPLDAEIKDLRPGGHLMIANKTSDYAFDSPKLALAAVIVFPEEEFRIRETGVVTDGLERFYEVDPDHPRISFSNKRKLKAPFYVFRKLA